MSSNYSTDDDDVIPIGNFHNDQRRDESRESPMDYKLGGNAQSGRGNGVKPPFMQPGGQSGQPSATSTGKTQNGSTKKCHQANIITG